MKINEQSPRATSLAFAQLLPGQVYKSIDGFYYLKTSGDRAVNLITDEINEKGYFVGSIFYVVDAELIIK